MNEFFWGFLVTFFGLFILMPILAGLTRAFGV